MRHAHGYTLPPAHGPTAPTLQPACCPQADGSLAARTLACCFHCTCCRTSRAGYVTAGALRRCAAGGRNPVLLPAPQRHHQPAAVGAGAFHTWHLPLRRCCYRHLCYSSGLLGALHRCCIASCSTCCYMYSMSTSRQACLAATLRPCGDTILILTCLQALAQRSDEVHVQLAEQSPGVSFTQGSASGVSFTQGSASSGSRLTRSFSRSATAGSHPCWQPPLARLCATVTLTVLPSFNQRGNPACSTELSERWRTVLEKYARSWGMSSRNLACVLNPAGGGWGPSQTSWMASRWTCLAAQRLMARRI